MGDTPQSLSAPNAVRQSDAKRLDHVDGSGIDDGNLGSTPSRSTLGHNEEGTPMNGVVVIRDPLTLARSFTGRTDDSQSSKGGSIPPRAAGSVCREQEQGSIPGKA